jgi:hypothetical protein
MASTFWAELYFRSLKISRVLPLLTKYLLRYKRVCIPGVGTFEIVQQSPQLNVADKLITAPAYTVKHNLTDQVPDQQVQFLASAGTKNESFSQELFSFGEKLKRKIQESPFHWNGLGTLRSAASEIVFEPDAIMLPSLQAVPARKVLRENVQHNVLVGDREMTSQQVTDKLNYVEYKRPWFIIFGWTVLVLALIAVVIFLYLQHFQTTSTGMQLTW